MSIRTRDGDDIVTCNGCGANEACEGLPVAETVADLVLEGWAENGKGHWCPACKLSGPKPTPVKVSRKVRSKMAPEPKPVLTGDAAERARLRAINDRVSRRMGYWKRLHA